MSKQLYKMQMLESFFLLLLEIFSEIHTLWLLLLLCPQNK